MAQGEATKTTTEKIIEFQNSDFVIGSSKASNGLANFWDLILKPIFDFMKPLQDSAEGLVKLLKLLP